MNRISTFGHTDTLIRQAMRLQSEYGAKQIQTSSGLKSENYQGIAPDAQKLVNLESLYSRITSQATSSKTAQDKINSMYDTFGQMGDLLTSLMSSLSAAMSSGNNSSSATSLQSKAQQSLEEFVSLLNTQYAGNYLFGGAVTNTAPVDINASGYDPVSAPTTASAGYYQGDQTLQSVQVSDSLRLSYGITADNSAFEQVLRGLSLISNSAGATDQDMLKQVYDLLQNAANSIANVKADTSAKSQTLDGQINLQTATLAHLDTTISDLRNVDLASVAVQLSEIETQLEASYSALTKLLSLNLHDYLK